MEDLIDLMTKHTSVRSFKNKKLSTETKNTLITAAQSGASSNFVQAYSIIEVTDSEIRDQIGNISQSAPYVINSGAFYVFVVDYYRHSQLLKKANLSLAGITNMEAVLVGSVDTAIAGQNMALAAESMGLGICYIGGIRNDIGKIAQLLHLPKYTFPLFGMTIGYPLHKNEVKPRLPHKNMSFTNHYNKEKAIDLADYQQITNKYYNTRSSNAQDTDWTKKMQEFLSVARRPDIQAFLQKQGFKI